MSLSDYSSDDSFEAEDSQVSQKAVRGLTKDKMSGRGARGSDAGYSTVRIVSESRLCPIWELCTNASTLADKVTVPVAIFMSDNCHNEKIIKQCLPFQAVPVHCGSDVRN